MPYAIIQPPFTLEFREMSKKELKAYFDWFLAEIPVRVAELERAVIATAGFAEWRADKSVRSLTALGDWFASQVETRPRTDDEMREIRAASTFPIEIPNQELTNRTFSLAMDTGMYLGETFRAQFPHLTWQQQLKGKKYNDYGRAVLEGFGPVSLEPVGILITLAYGISDKSRTGSRLAELYKYWAAKAETAVKGS